MNAIFLLRRYALQIVLYCLPSLALLRYGEILATPMPAIVLLQVLNVATGICYTIIPDTLQTKSLQGELTIHMHPPQPTLFEEFIAACGKHHYWHWPAMLVMADGFMRHTMNGSTMALVEGWIGFAMLISIDGWMLWKSAETVRKFAARKQGDG